MAKTKSKDKVTFQDKCASIAALIVMAADAEKVELQVVCDEVIKVLNGGK